MQENKHKSTQANNKEERVVGDNIKAKNIKAPIEAKGTVKEITAKKVITTKDSVKAEEKINIIAENIDTSKKAKAETKAVKKRAKSKETTAKKVPSKSVAKTTASKTEEIIVAPEGKATTDTKKVPSKSVAKTAANKAEKIVVTTKSKKTTDTSETSTKSASKTDPSKAEKIIATPKSKVIADTSKTPSKSLGKRTTSKTEETVAASKSKVTNDKRKSPAKKSTVAQPKADAKKVVNIQTKVDVEEEIKPQSKAEQIKNTVKKVVEKVDKTDITSFNTYLFHQGKNYESYNILGSHIKNEKRNKGVQFATWAPNAKDVYVVGDFSDFEVKDEYKMEKITENGLWKGFFLGVKSGDKYKYCVIGKDSERGQYKADPYAIQSEIRPDSASIVYEPKQFKWNDKKWIAKRNNINVLEQPLNIYEVHLGSWKTNKDGGFLTYEEIAKQLPKYVKEMGYTHVEIMPLVEHPLDASWGYQGTGYYSPTSRYGTIEGLKKLINKLHEENIGVIMDWVPGHFCKDAHGLYKFDGTPTYEYQEEWRAENKGWGTCNFDLGRPEVKSYLISNALYWYREFHIDGLRVDAVSSILYLDYSRSNGEWVPNKFGGNGNLEAIDFLKELNKAVFAEYSTALMIAEESTSWPNITKPTDKDGLGFNLKWNMGWMNDTLEYVEIDPKYRKNNHRNITFAMMYNHAENYLLPLSHDEVVHGKKSLIDKMWGDEWNKFAGLRAFMGYMMAHPGKKLTFMGCEFAQTIEWREYEELEWNIIEELEIHKKIQLFNKDLNNLYVNNKAFWELDHDSRGFNWIEADNANQSIVIFTRRSRDDQDTLVFVINFTSTVYYDYQIGVPFLGTYKEIFNTDDTKYGGSGQIIEGELISEKAPFQKQPYSIKIKVPPMATLVLKVSEINIMQEAKLLKDIDIIENDDFKEMNQ